MGRTVYLPTLYPKFKPNVGQYTMDPMGLGLTIFSVKVSGMQVISKMFMKNWGCLFSPVHGAGF